MFFVGSEDFYSLYLPKPSTFSDSTSLCRAAGSCFSCDAWLGLPGMKVLSVADEGDRLVVRVEPVPLSPTSRVPACGIVAHAYGRDEVALVAVPPVRAPGAVGLGQAPIPGTLCLCSG